MIKDLKNGGKRAEIDRARYKTHPEFMPRYLAELEKLQYPINEITFAWRRALRNALNSSAFGKLGLPIDRYKIYNTGVLGNFTIGMIKHSCDLIINSTPNELDLASRNLSYNSYAELIDECIRMQAKIESLIGPVREKIIDELILQEAPSIIKM